MMIGEGECPNTIFLEMKRKNNFKFENDTSVYYF